MDFPASCAAARRPAVTGVHGLKRSLGLSKFANCIKAENSMKWSWRITSMGSSSSSVHIMLRSALLMFDCTSSRTARPKRRRRSSISTAARRSSASSSSSDKSAFRVTRNREVLTISIPGNRRSRCASMRSSSKMKSSESGTGMQRGKLRGTLTRANR